MLAKTTLRLRQGSVDDLQAVNELVTTCVSGWDIPERVKRLSMSSYLYSPLDLQHLTLFIVENQADEIIGVAAIEEAETTDLPASSRGLLLHGIYVSPDNQQQGVGKQLLRKAIDAVKSRRLTGLLVKAQADATGFFIAQGFDSLPVTDDSRDYPHRFWLAV